MLQITVDTITGRSFKLRVSPHETVYFVKVKICQLEGIPVSHQILIWKSTELSNDQTLLFYNIPNSATLRLTLTMKGGPINSVLAEEPSLQDVVEYLAEPGDIPSSSSSSSSSLVSEKKHSAVILYRYGGHTVRIASKDLVHPEAYSVEKWNVKLEDMKSRNERQLENRILRDKMASLREQMQKVALNKERKVEPEISFIDPDSEETADDAEVAGHSSRLLLPSLTKCDKPQMPSSSDDDKSSATIQSVRNLEDSVSIQDAAFHRDPVTLLEMKTPVSQSWYRRLDMPWSERNFRAFIDLRCSTETSSSPATSSSSESNLGSTTNNDDDNEDDDDEEEEEEEEVDAEEDDVDSTSNVYNSIVPLVFKETIDENNNLLSEESRVFQCNPDFFAKDDHHQPSLSTVTNAADAIHPQPSSDNREPSIDLSSVQEATNEECDSIAATLADDESHLRPLRDALLTLSSDRSRFSELASLPENHTFLDVLRNNRQRLKMKKELCSSRTEESLPLKVDGRIVRPDSTDAPRGEGEGRPVEDSSDGKSFRKDSNKSPILPKLSKEEPTDSSKNFLISQSMLPLIRKPPKSPNSLLDIKSQNLYLRSRNVACPYGLLPPVHVKSPSRTNQRCLSKLASPRLPARKDNFSPLLKNKTNCLNNVNNSCYRECTPWTAQRTSRDDGRESDDDDFCAALDELPALEIPGSLLLSDLSGYKVRVKKFAEERRTIHSPNLNVIKMIEAMTRENPGLRSNKRATPKVEKKLDVLTRPHQSEQTSEAGVVDLPAGAVDLPAGASIPRKKCAVCRKKTSLACSFACRCGQNLCTSHRYPEAHSCNVDYKLEGRKILEERNPIVRAPKLPKI